MSQQIISETRELEYNDVDSSTNPIEEGTYRTEQEPENEIYLESKKAESETPSSFLKDLQSLVSSSQCPIHPEEELQFYCFDNHTTLCAECLVKGGYAGKDIANLKKSAERLKLRLKDLALETANKLEVFDLQEKEIGNCEAQIEESASRQKNEIQEKMNALRQAIDMKEQELLEKVDTTHEERLNALRGTVSDLENNKEEMQSIKDILEDNLKDLNDLSICNFYSKKSEIIRSHFNDEAGQKVQKLKRTLERHQFQDEANMDKFQEACEKTQTGVNTLGNEIGKNKFEILTLSSETVENVVVRTNSRSPKPTTFFKEDSALNRPMIPKEILLVQSLTPREAGSKNVSSYLPKKSYKEQASPVLSSIQLSEKTTLMVERGREDRNKQESLKAPFFMYTNPMLNRTKERSVKKLESKEYSSTSKIFNFDAPHPKSSTLNDSKSTLTKALDSILISKSPKTTSSKSRLFESHLDQVKSNRATTATFNPTEQFKNSKKNILKGSEGLVELDFGSLLSSKKMHKKPEEVFQNEGRLKQKLEKLNYKLFN